MKTLLFSGVLLVGFMNNTKANLVVLDTIPMIVEQIDTTIVFDPETYEETMMVVKSEVFNPDYFLQEKFLKDTIMVMDTVMNVNPMNGRKELEIYRTYMPSGISKLLDYEYSKNIPDIEKIQEYLRYCRKEKMN
ncbi:MAG TPA: hypothetical protein PK147_07580 [Saprospiraceae bacterium]|nr:hypothetical protein [Saprospiraceae bacterium]